MRREDEGKCYFQSEVEGERDVWHAEGFVFESSVDEGNVGYGPTDTARDYRNFKGDGWRFVINFFFYCLIKN